MIPFAWVDETETLCKLFSNETLLAVIDHSDKQNALVRVYFGDYAVEGFANRGQYSLAREVVSNFARKFLDGLAKFKHPDETERSRNGRKVKYPFDYMEVGERIIDMGGASAISIKNYGRKIGAEFDPPRRFSFDELPDGRLKIIRKV